MTEAETVASTQPFITPGVLRAYFGAEVNPEHGMFQFHDGSIGRFSEIAAINPDTNKAAYPFVVGKAGLRFPNAEADKSADVTPKASGRSVKVLTKEG